MKFKISVRLLGHKPPDLDTRRILAWKSDLWEIHEGQIDTVPLNGDSDLPSWGYSDVELSKKVPMTEGALMTLYILNDPLEDNY